jgi:3'(2'), 5'-bisphosphate nucleotidase
LTFIVLRFGVGMGMGHWCSYLTVADQRAQRVVIDGLRAAFGDTLDIVGEEDEEEDVVPDTGCGLTVGAGGVSTHHAAAEAVSAAAAAVSSGSYVIPADLEDLNRRDVTVFVDPLDGTREFVKGRIEAVQSLIGVAYRGRYVECGQLLHRHGRKASSFL